MVKIAMDSKKTRKELVRVQEIGQEACSKLVRLAAASRAACQGGSQEIEGECQAKAKRSNPARVIARNFWPWPK